MRAGPAIPAIVLVIAFVALSGSSLGTPTGGRGGTISATTTIRTDAGAAFAAREGAALPATQPLSLTVTLQSRDPSGLEAFVAAVGDPHSGAYRHYLTEPQFEQRFGPSTASVDAIRSYFAQYGARSFAVTPDRLGVTFSIPAAGASRALGVSFVQPAGAPGGYLAEGAVQLPAALAKTVSAISGLSHTAPAPRSVDTLRPVARGVSAASPNSFVIDGAGAGEPWYVGTDYASAYHATQLFPGSSSVSNATYPTGEAVATLLMSGYNQTTDADLPPFDPVVVGGYFNDTFPAAWPHPTVRGVPVNVSGDVPPAPGYFGGLNDTTDNSVENSLDLEMAGSFAPGALLVNFYFGGAILASPRYNVSVADLANAFAQSLSAALSYNYSPQHLSVVSGSFGLPDLNDSLWDAELVHAEALGVSVVASSGDQGNAPTAVSGRFQGQWPSWPATAAFESSGTIAVGGVSANVTGTPTATYDGVSELTPSYDATVTGLAGQPAWYDTLGGYGNVSGSEGGASAVIAEPAWQFRSAAQPAIVNATVQQGQTTLGRSEPDVAFPANQTIAYVSRDPSGTYFEVLEGTSIAAPIFAGLIASWSAVAGHTFGYLDPSLYRMSSFFAANPSDAANPFLDATTGSNYAFQAAPGWDAVTGWGGIDAVRFLAAYGNASIQNYTYTGPSPGLPPPVAPPTMQAPSLLLLGIIGIAVAVAVALVITVARPRRPPAYAYPPGVHGEPLAPHPPGAGPLPPPAPGSSPAPGPPAPFTFLCPYCGAPRPAEPIRCPYCGRL